MQRLFLFDFDGICVSPGEITLDSLFWKINDALTLVGAPKLSVGTMQDIYQRTSGTTELRLIQEITNEAKLVYARQEIFKNTFLRLRNIHLGLANRDYDKLISPRLHDTSYADTAFFISNQTTEDDLVWLTTGNPREAMRTRLTLNPDWKKVFMSDDEGLPGAFGEEKMTRKELIELAMDRAKNEGFEPIYDVDGYSTNVVYV